MPGNQDLLLQTLTSVVGALVLLTIGALRKAWPAVRSLGAREWTYLILIGAGASATATALFTAAFRYGDPTTPLLLQKLQPLFAILGAWILLGERLRPRFWGFAAVALGAAWLIVQQGDPTGGLLPIFALPPRDLAVGVALLAGTGVLAGAAPALEAMRLCITDALRRN